MDAKPVVLKVLLQHRHLQTHRAFCREYDRVAAKTDPTLREVGQARRSSTGGYPVNWLDFPTPTTVAF